MRRKPCCYTFFSSILKFINFLQFFIGFCMIIYAIFMLYHWHHHHHSLNDTLASPSGSSIATDLFVANLVNGVLLKFQSLPAPWFIYVFMSMGILVCCIACSGHIAAEAFNGCCLCFYVVLTTVFILLEASLVAFIAIDRSWEKDLPVEPTGELDTLRIFIEENMDICKWVGIVVITLQVSSLLLAIILRALVSREKVDGYSEEEYGGSGRGRPHAPLLNAPLMQTSTGDSNVTQPDMWNSQLREKYGLNNYETTKSLLASTSSIDSRKSSAG